ncbi:hypothetical protein FVB9288_01766 [Flavobacterium sp. CECT 9288]|uniref:hypothetical protein n=1 Tax=Flavobacterium sp. CECT 9288 TaxID=2845819 RepID=UPI001E593BC2|nr:hypothetical protein [Flavobacterium sp. CECT 9288]CAH0336092.1 hypothetical protein FVB9288_01766 [Flavobacterium sp. CECT 9288]
MKKNILILHIILMILISCTKKDEIIQKYTVENQDLVTETIVVNKKINNKDTIKAFYLKGKLISIAVKDYIISEYDTKEEPPFFYENFYLINAKNIFYASKDELNNIVRIANYCKNKEYDIKNKKIIETSSISSFFYDYEILNLDLALTKIGIYIYPKPAFTVPEKDLNSYYTDQKNRIKLYDITNMRLVKEIETKDFSFRYLRNIKVINNKEKIIFAKIINDEDDKLYYINLKDIKGDIKFVD